MGCLTHLRCWRKTEHRASRRELPRSRDPPAACITLGMAITVRRASRSGRIWIARAISGSAGRNLSVYWTYPNQVFALAARVGAGVPVAPMEPAHRPAPGGRSFNREVTKAWAALAGERCQRKSWKT